MTPTDRTVDADEIAQFARLSAEWWDPHGRFRPLHALAPVRLAYIRDRLVGHFGLDATADRPLDGLRLIDVGCGGGLVSEPLARLGASVVGVDAGAETIAAARAHAESEGVVVDYRHATIETVAAGGEHFDAVISMEVVEHVADLGAFLGTCAAVTRPGGALVLSTLNRTPQSFALAIVGAEYILRWLPRGTHDWRKFVRPSELAGHLRAAGCRLDDLCGVTYELGTGTWKASRDTSVNYMAAASRPS